MSNHRYCYPTVTPLPRPAEASPATSAPKPGASTAVSDPSPQAAA